MAGCIPNAGSNPPSPNTQTRWKESINNVLATNAGRHIFKEFLKKKEFHEVILALQFWEMCHKWVPKEDSASQKNRNLQDNIFTEVDEILKYANEKNINLDHGVLKSIATAAKEKNYEQTIKYLLKAKQNVTDELNVHHGEFKKTL